MKFVIQLLPFTLKHAFAGGEPTLMFKTRFALTVHPIVIIAQVLQLMSALLASKIKIEYWSALHVFVIPTTIWNPNSAKLVLKSIPTSVIEDSYTYS